MAFWQTLRVSHDSLGAFSANDCAAGCGAGRKLIDNVKAIEALHSFVSRLDSLLQCWGALQLLKFFPLSFTRGKKF
ncbi:hypothetical protein [Mandarin fish ranavirus]|nr:hypothetical protein [Mandarin fish ranavirus]